MCTSSSTTILLAQRGLATKNSSTVQQQNDIEAMTNAATVSGDDDDDDDDDDGDGTQLQFGAKDTEVCAASATLSVSLAIAVFVCVVGRRLFL